MAMIEARGLARTFKARHGQPPVHAVKGIDFTVAEGEIVGLLGPNGAGKTTTQRMLSTLLDPTAGEATVAGCDLRRDPVGVRRQLGYVSQSGGTNPAARVDEELATQGELYGMTRKEGCTDANHITTAVWPNCPDKLFQFHHQAFNYFAAFAPGTANRRAHLRDEAEFIQRAKDGRLWQVSFVKPLGSA